MSTNSTIKAIPTHYKAYTTRSRLEARWMVFFDTIGLPFVYELEGYKLKDGINYLPDFFLPIIDVFAEVKPFVPDNDAKNKARLLAEGTGKPVIILGCTDLIINRPIPFGHVAFVPRAGQVIQTTVDHLAQCDFCRTIYFVFRDLRSPCPKCGRTAHHEVEELLAAMAGLSASFENGAAVFHDALRLQPKSRFHPPNSLTTMALIIHVLMVWVAVVIVAHTIPLDLPVFFLMLLLIVLSSVINFAKDRKR